MAQVYQDGILLGIRPLDFVDKKTGEVVQGVKLVLARPADDEKYEGVGYTIFDLKHMGSEGLSSYSRFKSQCDKLFMQAVRVECDMIPGGKSFRLKPLSVSLA